MDKEQLLECYKKQLQSGESTDAKNYCRTILQKVSRTYALTIRALGQPFREPVLIGYLLCRIADTYEDTDKVPYAQKYEALETFKKIFTNETSLEEAITKIREIVTPYFSLDDDEEFLAIFLEPVFEQYYSFSNEIQKIVARTVIEMVEGMMTTIKKQHEQGEVGTDTEEELDQYMYYVAGTVGNLLTDLFAYHSPWITKKLHRKLCTYNESFGRALQLTNIIKDAMGDLKRGVSFIPKDLARQYKVAPDKLHLPEHREQAHKVMSKLIVKAVGDLNKAMEYTLLIPKGEPRVRLFCVMPVLFAIKTLEVAMKNDDLLDPDKKVKITRDTVKKTLRFITVSCLWDYQLVKEYMKSVKVIEDGLGVTIEHNFKNNPILPIVSVDA